MRNTFIRGMVDGITSGIGAIIGAAVTLNPSIVMITGLTSAFSHSINDFFSYRREFNIDILDSTKKIEDLSNLDARYIRESPTFLKKKKEYKKKSLVGGLSSFIGKVILLIPFLFLSMVRSLITSILLGITISAICGVFIGKFTKEDKSRMALDMALTFFVSLAVGLLVVWVYGI